MSVADVDVHRLLAVLKIKPAKRSRREVWACCPAHAEKEPSWSILTVPGKRCGSHHCFGCGFGGGPQELVREVVGLGSMREAWYWIQSRNLLVDGVAPLDVKLTVRSGIMTEFVLPCDVVQTPLDRWVTPARRYAESRGLTSDEIAEWGIGYAVDGQLAGRIVIPICDDRGRLLSYTARSFVGEEPRYKNPHEKEGALHGAVWGERHWPEIQRRKDCTLVLCEGALNGLACIRVGAEYVGALGGSNLDSWQLAKLGGFGEILVVTDLDLAGNKAAGELRATLARHRRVRRASFPAGQDPALMWMHDPAGLRRCLWG